LGHQVSRRVGSIEPTHIHFMSLVYISIRPTVNKYAVFPVSLTVSPSP
jgi:hypothetical protein